MPKTFELMITLPIIFFIMAGVSRAEIMVKEKREIDSYYTNGQIRPGNTTEIQWWYSKKQIAFIDSNLKLVMDEKSGRLLVCNLNTSTYTELNLPIQPASDIDSNIPTKLENYSIDGRYKDTGKKETVEKKKCRVFSGNDELRYGPTIFYGRDRKLMVTADVPFDWKLKDNLFKHIRGIFNPKKKLLDDLKQINGFTWVSENTFMFRGSAIKTRSVILEVVDKKPPANLYSFPGNYKKKERLTYLELRQIRGIVYW